MITVVVPVSPIPSHPDTHVLEETVASVRHHLPSAELFLSFDGVRPEQEHMREAYEEATRRTLWLADKSWGNVCPFVWDCHLHQVGMLRRVIDEIRTPLMLFVEQDTPLYTTETIDWEACSDFILSGEADVVRMYHESAVPEAHTHMMRERKGQFLRTVQFSARPHLASTTYYKRILTDHFTPEANTFIEDPMHSACQSWPDEHKLWIYAPEGETWLRSRHLDGRAGEDKFESKLIF